MAMLPYLKTSPLGTDIQPHFAATLCLLIAVCMATRARAPFSDFALYLSILLGTSAWLLGGRVDAIALAIIPLAIAVFTRADRKDLVFGLKAALVCYCVGIALEVIAPTVLDALVSNRRAAYSRGFTSLASEPSYLGLIGLVFVILFMVTEQKRTWICASCGLCLASGSLTAIAPLFFIMLIRMLRPNLAHIFIGISCMGILLAMAAAQTESRVGLLFVSVLTDPTTLLFDESVSNRIARAFTPLASAYYSGFVPHKFPAAGEIDVTFGFLADTADTQIERLSSLATILIYVYGLISLPLILGYLHIARAPLYVMIALGYLCVTNISISTPYLYLMLSLPLLVRHSSIHVQHASTQHHQQHA